MSQIKQFNFTQEQIAKLCKMQDELNSYIHPEWKILGFNWNLAILDECMEIHGHLGWKWWKKDYKVGLTDANKKQVQLEVIDILHFVLSSWIESGDVGYLLENFNAPYTDALPLEFCVNKTLEFAGPGRADMLMECWVRLAIVSGLTEQEILETYTQKYVLNKFRQDNGYKTGEYVKEWKHNYPTPQTQQDPQGDIVCVSMEDNEVLAEIVHELGSEGEDTTNETLLYNKLSLAYNSRLNK